MNKTRQITIRIAALEIRELAHAIGNAFAGQLAFDHLMPKDPEAFDQAVAITALKDAFALELAFISMRQQIVSQARRAGASWEDIGVSLGMTKQSAWERWNRD